MTKREHQNDKAPVEERTGEEALERMKALTRRIIEVPKSALKTAPALPQPKKA